MEAGGGGGGGRWRWNGWNLISKKHAQNTCLACHTSSIYPLSIYQIHFCALLVCLVHAYMTLYLPCLAFLALYIPPHSIHSPFIIHLKYYSFIHGLHSFLYTHYLPSWQPSLVYIPLPFVPWPYLLYLFIWVVLRIILHEA